MVEFPILVVNTPSNLKENIQLDKAFRLTGNASTTLESDFVANLWERISEEPKKFNQLQMSKDKD